jgi:hypothetical protein
MLLASSWGPAEIWVHKALPVRFGHTLQFVFFLEKCGYSRINGHAGMENKGRRRGEQTLMAYEFEDPFAAFINSSARHSAMDLTLRNADSRVWKISDEDDDRRI